MTPDVLVVGAGIVGAACAEQLAAEGLRVTVVDRRLAGGATAEAMGHLLVVDEDPDLLALTAWSRRLWEARASQLPAAADWDPCGTLWVASEPEEMAIARAKAARLAVAGIEAHVVDADGVAALEPRARPGLAGGLHVPHDRVVYPPVAAAWFLERARDRGAELRLGDGVAEVQPRGVMLETGERLEAAHIVVAAGVGTAALLGDRLGVEIHPRRGHLAITRPAPGLVRHQLVELGYLASASGNADRSVAFNLQPRPNGQVLIGSSREYGVLERGVDRALTAEMLRRAIDFVPALADVDVLRVWTGFRPATADKLPVIGPLPETPSIHVAGGHEGLGITTSLASAAIVRDQLLGRSSPIDTVAFAVDRPHRRKASA